MKKWFVIWTYVANYGKMWVDAETAEQAAQTVVRAFSEDFARRGNVYVFDKAASFIYNDW